MKWLIIAIIYAVGCSVNLFSQIESDKDHKAFTDSFFLEMKKDKQTEVSFPSLSDWPAIEHLDKKTKESYLASLRAFYSYRSIGYTHRQEVFEYQLYSSRIIFIVVIFLVIVGVYFSGVQFHSSLKWKRSKNDSEKDDRTEIVASLKGIKVSSPILGVIILVISLMFFYLYLIHVYPIKEVF